MKFNHKQSEAIAKFLIDIVKIIITVFIIGGLVPNSPIVLKHFFVATISAIVIFVVAIKLLKQEG